MENKRKAGGSNESPGLADGEDRVAKRRKHETSPSLAKYDLFQGETAESTKAYGLDFLQHVRRTNDKNGRLVAVGFEHLPSRDHSKDYYKKTEMPICLQIIEKKLYSHEFPNLSALEGYFKRMLRNAKEYYREDPEVVADTERLRKSLSNYMVKTNPAYKLIPGYSCPPTPLPSESAVQQPSGTKRQHKPVAKVESDAGGEDDADGEEDEDADGDEEDDEEDEQQEEEDDDSDAGPRARRGSRRSRRTSSQVAQKTAEKYVVPSKTKQDHEYEGIAYKRLSFQQAQEKIVEEMIREEDEDEPGWMKFEAFLHLPPRSLKEYFSVITDPLSLRALQKLVKGIHGRQPPTGTSDFKSWAAFEEKASLLWNNAHYFNEEGSQIYDLATELQGFFQAQFKEAKAAVAEPLQPKIKLKVSSGQETPAQTPTGPKKIITIHVANSRGSTAASPAPLTAGRAGDSGAPEMAQNGAPAQQGSPAAPNGGPPAVANAAQIEIVKSASAVVASPSPSAAGLQQGPAAHQSPAVGPRPNGASSHPVGTPNGVGTPGQVPADPQNQLSAPVPNNIPRYLGPPKPSYDRKWRSPTKGVADALIQNLIVRTHPSINVDDRFTFELPAHPRLAQQYATLTIPSNQHKMQLILTMAPLEQQSRQYKLFVMHNGMTLLRTHPTPIPGDRVQFTPNTLVFDAQLQRGLQYIEVHLIAALPYNEWQHGHENCELEKFVLVTHLQV